MEVDRRKLSEVCAQFANAFSNLAEILAAGIPETTTQVTKTELSEPEASALVEAEKPVKRMRAPKDPNAPKKPVSAYLLFYQEQVPKIKAQMSESPADGPSLASKIGHLWESVDKTPYVQRADKLREEYQGRMKEYRDTLGSSPVPKRPATEDAESPPTKKEKKSKKESIVESNSSVAVAPSVDEKAADSMTSEHQQPDQASPEKEKKKKKSKKHKHHDTSPVLQ